jgi:hypothetical protein
MVEWVVMVKTPEATQTIPIEADFVENSDDGKEVHFSSLKPVVEAFEAFETIKPELPRDQSIAAFQKMIHALSKISVASFKTEFVLGYYQPGQVEVR